MFELCFHCYYPTGSACIKRQLLPLDDIPRWIDSYKFTHPDCIAISVKVWFSGDKEVNQE